MEAIKCIKERRSIRKFIEDSIDKQVIKDIVEAASYAPSWKNTQITRYTVVTNKDKIEKLANDCVLGFEFNTKTMLNAPSIVVVSYVEGRCGYERDGSYSTSKEDRWQMFDGGIASQTFCLAAHDKGVGTVIMGIFDDDKVAQTINLPEGEKVAALIAMGYPKFAPEAPARKEVDELVRFEE